MRTHLLSLSSCSAATVDLSSGPSLLANPITGIITFAIALCILIDLHLLAGLSTKAARWYG